MRVVLTHGYSATNSGDGLLVRESRKLLDEAFGTVSFTLDALDPDSFSPTAMRTQHPLWPSAEPSKAQKVRAGIRALTLGLPTHRSIATRLSADLVVAVGGGYLRGSYLEEAFKSSIVHRPQLPIAAGPPSVYLPQSIGPFPDPMASWWLKRLRLAARVYVRDDRSLDLMDRLGIPSVRMPDLALLRLATQQVRPVRGHGIAVVARDLRDRNYTRRVRDLVQQTEAEILIQAHGGGNDDRAFARELGARKVRLLRDAIASDSPPAVVVSVRLHGSLEAILAGVPSVHLGYERKGWGAYEDLGLRDFVHSARHFDLLQVVDQAENVASQPERFWDKVTSSQSALLRRREHLVSDLRQIAEDAS